MLDAMRQQSGNNDAAAANSADSSTPAAALTVDDLLLLHADTVTVFDDTQVLSDCDGVKSTQTSAGVSVLYIVTKRRHTGTTSDNDDIDDEWEPVDVVSMEHEQYHQQLVDESATVAT